MAIKTHLKVSLLLLTSLSQACSTLIPPSHPSTSRTSPPHHNTSAFFRALNYHADLIANALIVNSHEEIKRKRLAVGTFVNASTLNNDVATTHPMFRLGQRLQEELISAMSQKSISVVEFRMTENIIVEETQDKMLSRTLPQLKSSQSIDYYLTGTYTNQSQGTAVNLRIIDVNTNNVISTSSHFIPIDVFGAPQSNTTQIINGYLYRNSTH